MSIVSEYLKLIPEAIKNRELIIDGIANKVKEKFGKLNEEEQHEIIRRRIICEACPFNSKNAKEKDGYMTDRLDDHCILCSCNIDLKTQSLMSNCGIEIWNLKHPDEKIPLKWETYKTKKDD